MAEVTSANPSKPFYTSSGFWVTTISSLSTVALMITENMDEKTGAILMAVIAGAYMLARGIGKIGAQHDSNSKPFWKTSEFGTVILGTILYLVMALGDVLPPELAAQLGTTLGVVYTLVRRMSKIGDPNEDLYKNKDLEDLLKKIADASKKASILLGFVFLSFSVTGCCSKKEVLPLGPVVQYFDSEDGAMARYLNWIAEKETSGEISESQALIYRAEIESVGNLVTELKSMD